MSGLCSAHRHYDRECPRCQTEVPAWVAELEQALAHERGLNARFKAALEEIASTPGVVAPRLGGDFARNTARAALRLAQSKEQSNVGG